MVLFSVCFQSKISWGQEKVKEVKRYLPAKDTVYFLVDTLAVPAKDRMFEITDEGKFKTFGLLCKCYQFGMDAYFYHDLTSGKKFIDREEFEKIKTVSINELITITAQFAKDKIDKTAFYFIEPDGQKMRVTRVYLMENRKPVKVW